jgi:hypothetical protein
MSSYKRLHKNYVSWKSRYGGVIREDFPLTGHPLLEIYISSMMVLARERWPRLGDYDLEPMLLYEFAFPENPDRRQRLISDFFPPLVQFRNGERWINRIPRYEHSVENFGKSMAEFSALMGAAWGLLARASGASISHGCPHSSCPLHRFGTCSYVMQFPNFVEECRFRELFHQEFSLSAKK